MSVMLRRLLFPVFVMKPDDGGGSGNPPDPADPAAKNPPPANPPADPPADPDDNLTGLRTALDAERTRAKEFEKELKALKRDALPEGERLKAENADLRGQVDRLTGELSTMKIGSKAESVARDLGFKKPDRAMKALQLYTDVDVTTLDSEDKVKKALDELATKEPDLVEKPPPTGGPITPASGQQPAGNAGFNAAIRARAGRA